MVNAPEVSLLSFNIIHYKEVLIFDNGRNVKSEYATRITHVSNVDIENQAVMFTNTWHTETHQ
jgi:hypothetical protein